ncbi:MAG: DUF4912 domain-containing protein [Lachnospiraceae bacterium]|jgi:hypothetical protein|nr:DUF4912 domain-containing protein [Lachnospiraceae bacterium]
MPKKTKEEIAKKELNKKTKTTAKRTPKTEITTKSKKTTVKKEPAKKATTKRTSKTETQPKTTTKKTTSKTKTETQTKTTTKSTSERRGVSHTPKIKSTTKKNKLTTTPESSMHPYNEYYDLPPRYNETVVKLLAQSPKRLFVYWDISDEDKQNCKNKFGVDFFNITVPVLYIKNNTLGYSFETQINDFADTWYFDVQDTKNDYYVELRRKPKSSDIFIPNNFVHIASSNVIENPNDHILFEKEQKLIHFKNVKTNKEYFKTISDLSFVKTITNAYNIQNIYKDIYTKEDIIDLNNPSSSNPTSTFK